MKAIMLAAGAGTRCYPLTYLSPKICQQVAGIPLVEYMLSWFSGTSEIEKLYVVLRGASDVATMTRYFEMRKNYLSKIRDMFEQFGYAVHYENPYLEIEVLEADGHGTGGDLRHVLDKIGLLHDSGEDFLLSYADYIIHRQLPDGRISPQMGLAGLIEYHKACRETLGTSVTATLVSVTREKATRFGVAKVEEFGGFQLIRGFMEKPDVRDVPKEPLINAGVYIINSEFISSQFKRLDSTKWDFSLERDIVEPAVRLAKPVMAAYVPDLEAWFDVGTVDELIKVNQYVASGRWAVERPKHTIQQTVW